MSIEESNPTLLEKILAYASLSIIAFSILSFFATLIAALVGVDREILAQGFWPVVAWLGYVGLPIGFVLMITLITLTRRRRKREAADSQR